MEVVAKHDKAEERNLEWCTIRKRQLENLVETEE